MKQRYIKLSEYAKNKSVTYRTAWKHFKNDKIEGAYQDNSGNILVPELNDKDYSKCALYARVSSNDMKENLNRQLNRLNLYAQENNYNIIKSVKEVSSGMNDNRPKLNNLLDNNEWNTLIIENKDRLTRFGFNYIKRLLENNNKRIIILNESNDDKSDLMQDLISIIYSFSARMYGLRRKKNKQDIIDFIKK